MIIDNYYVASPYSVASPFVWIMIHGHGPDGSSVHLSFVAGIN